MFFPSVRHFFHRLFDIAGESLDLEAGCFGSDLVKHLDFRLQKGQAFRPAFHLGARNSLDKDAYPLIRHFEHADHHADGAEFVQFLRRRALHLRIALGQKEDHAVLRQRMIYRMNGLIERHQQRQDHVRKSNHVL